MKRQSGFSIIELVLVIGLVAILAITVFNIFYDLHEQGIESAEAGVVGAVRSGIQNYGGESQTLERQPRFPAALDSAPNGDASGANPFFTTILNPSISADWNKTGLTYTGPMNVSYAYDPTQGSFNQSGVLAGLAMGLSFNEGDGNSVGEGDLAGEIVGNAEWTEGLVDDALDFDGWDSYVTIPDADSLDLREAGTISSWINYDDIPPFAGIVHKGDEANFSDEAYSLQFWTGDDLAIILHPDSGPYQILTTPFDFQPGEWYHVAATWDSNGMNLYVNGQLSTSNDTAVEVRNSDGDLQIGSQLPTYYNDPWRNLPYDGQLDEVNIYDRALTPEEISAYYGTIMP